MASEFNYYSLLGVSPNATLAEIKAAYRSAVAKYHPDVNQASNAANLTAILNEAWSVLQDPVKKAEYDATLQSGYTKKKEAKAAKTQKSSEPLDSLLLCERCGEEDVHQRFVIFHRVTSMVFTTHITTTAQRLCTRCRSHEAWASAFHTAFFGVWQFPWGVIHTIRALYVAVQGGAMDKRSNVAMLIYLSNAYAQRENNDAAVTILDACYRLQRNKDVAEALKSFKDAGGRITQSPRWLDGQTIALAAAFIPIILVGAVYTGLHIFWLHWSHEHRAEVARWTRMLKKATQNHER